MFKTLLSVAAVTVAWFACPAILPAAVLLSDDMSTGTNWTVAGTADTAATFGFDYSTVGVPMAPGAANTLALKLEANNGDAVTGAEAINTVTNAVFSGTYNVQFDMWANYTGPLELGGAGSTEFIGGAIGHDGVTPSFAVSGANLYFTGDAGSGTDLRAYESGSLQGLGDGGFNPALTGLNHPDINGELGLFPSTAAPAAQIALHPSQTEMTRAGAAGFDWRHYSIFVNAGAGNDKASFFVDGVHVVTLDAANGAGFSTSGGVALTYADIFSSVAGNPAVSFGLFTNVEITDTPEPTSLALMGLALIGLASVRRR